MSYHNDSTGPSVSELRCSIKDEPWPWVISELRITSLDSYTSSIILHPTKDF
ncbi:hypothetical protein BGZ61DRAFT_455173 [Ilyonectria robusta]|uniref:uncharacterized protein n=1 Tax=Ilyonectria robusta TaxID=1079257 RepID=UPI001E8D33BF|nr:uncharacterized protein BGZ61DRAFT_455173 [Ilyonectria robusta]KAH8685250.1 hypothetical protein BGZ61DRAFT_455173 [Ilyonectria robusta]